LDITHSGVNVMLKQILVTTALAVLAACTPSQKPDFTDQKYAESSSRNVLDIYLPKGAANPPLVLWIHGGAFKFGDKAKPEGLAEFLKAGIAVASMNYRYSSEAIWPAQLDDLRAAVIFLRTNAGKYGYDGTRIASFGASAGGHLSAMAGIALAGVPATRLAAAVAWFPPVDFTTMDADIEATGVTRKTGRNDAADSPESQLVAAPVGDNPQKALEASPLTHVARLPAGVSPPPFLVMHGAQDQMIGHGQSERLVAALEARGGSAKFVLLPNGGHGDGDFKKPETIAQVIEFLAAQFGNNLRN
jgi:acetyl esterase/lipase